MSLYTEKTLEKASLGRTMHIGMLYDCRDDRVIPGVTLWNKATLQDHTILTENKSCQFEVIAEDNLESKAHSLDIDANVKLSFLAGLISVSGSAKYLDDKKTSQHQSRVTLNFKSSTFLEEMSMEHLAYENIQYKEVFDKGTATHVITAVEYGANAIFVFDRQLDSDEEIRNVEGSLQMAVKKIPTLSVGGQAQVNLTEKEQQDKKKFRCTFHGDLIFESLPQITTFDDAVAICQTLPNLIKKMTSNDGNNYGSPKKIYLYPLCLLDSKAAKLERMISDSLVNEAQTILETIDSFQVAANDLTEGTICKRFPGIRMQIKGFTDLVSRFATSFQKKLSTILPKVRGGDEEEEVLADMITDFKSSPFCSSKLKTWLDAKSEEANILEQFLKPLIDNCIFVSGDEKFEQHVYDTNVEHVLAMSFGPITNTFHPFLDELEVYLGNTQSTSQTDGSTKAHWFYDGAVKNQLRKQLRLFGEYAEASKENKGLRYLLLSQEHRTTDEFPLGAIILYKDGTPEVFQLPSSPECPEVASFDEENETELKWEQPKVGSEKVVKYSVAYRALKDDDLLQNWREALSESNALSLKLSALQPNTAYVFKVASVCEIGKSKYSKSSKPFTTAGPINNLEIPSPPGRPSRKYPCSCNNVSLVWEEPGVHLESVTKYNISYRILDVPDVLENWSHSESKTPPHVFRGLTPLTKYVFKVAAESDSGKSEYSPLSEPVETGYATKRACVCITSTH